MKHLLTSILLLSFCSTAGAQSTYYVPDDYATIQGGIDGIGGGDTLIVRDDTYTENINFNGKAITLKSENGAATTIIDGSQSATVIELSSGEGANSVIDGFTVKNGSAGVGGGIHCGSSTAASSPTIRNCVITGNNATIGGGGIYCENGSSPSLDGCTFTENKAVNGSTTEYGGGIYCKNSSPTLENCTFTENEADRGGGMYCTSNSSPTLTNCMFKTNVSPNLGGGGIYCEDSSPTLENCTFKENSGCGMKSSDGSSPTLENCTFTSNSGGGMNCHGNSTPILTNCTFADNTSPGVTCGDTSSPTFENCMFTSNSGGGMNCHGNSTPILTNCTFADNASPGVTCVDTSSPTFENCMFTGNSSAHGGGGMYCHGSSSPTLTNCTFTNNTTADEGGGGMVTVASSTPTLENCTFTNNTAGYGGGICSIDTSSPTLTNCIFWNNAATNTTGTTGGHEIYDSSTVTVTVTYSDVEGSNVWAGIGNINTDPLFVDPSNDDFRLQAGSPCIDAGDPNSPLDPDGTRADMGVIPFLDSDGDGLTDEEELSYGTDSQDQDTDDDGLSDGEEVLTFSTNPLNVDTDFDGIQDGTEVGSDTWWLGEPWNGIEGTDTSVNIPDADPSTTTDPLDDDTDNDGLIDGQEDVNQDGEFLGIELDPNDFDGDNDGLGDGMELGLTAPNGNDTDMTVFVADSDPSTTTRATFRDTDGGGIHDGIEDANRNGRIDAGEIDPRDASDDSVYMRISPMVEGGSVAFSYFGCEPGSLMVLCYSLVGTGPTFFTNLTLDLSQPIGSRPPLQISSNGTAQLGPVPIPPNIIVGDQLWFQGVQVSLFGSASYFTTTNMIPVTVQ
jgi:parallel beta-helix repeat protein